jgi:hypothetical protein
MIKTRLRVDLLQYIRRQIEPLSESFHSLHKEDSSHPQYSSAAVGMSVPVLLIACTSNIIVGYESPRHCVKILFIEYNIGEILSYR